MRRACIARGCRVEGRGGMGRFEEGRTEERGSASGWEGVEAFLLVN